MRQRLIKRLEEARLSPQEAEALVERMKNGIFSDKDRQRVLEALEAEQEGLGASGGVESAFCEHDAAQSQAQTADGQGITSSQSALRIVDQITYPFATCHSERSEESP